MSVKDSVFPSRAMAFWGLAAVLLLAAGSPPVQAQDDVPVGVESFTIPNLGGWSITSSGTEAETQVGYGRIRADAGSTTPSGIAIIGYRPGGTLVAEAGVPASELVREGRIFAEVNDPVNTGLALANPNDAPATINFYFTDADGARFSEDTYVLDAGRQISKFLNETPFNGGDTVSGTFTFTSSLPIAVIALRGFTNRDGEFLMTTLPVAPLATPLTPFTTDTAYRGTVYFPHFADGSGWATQVILVNPTDDTIAGTVRFLGQGSDTAAAAPAVRTLEDGRTGSSFEYSIPPNGSYRIVTSNPSGGVSVGSVRAIPDNGHRAPSGLVVFSFASAGKTVLEAGVPALPAASAFRVYVESSGMPEQAGSIRTGVAITNAADTANTVTLEVTDLDGTLAAPPGMLTLPPSGQVSRFIDEFFDSLPPEFSGVLRVTSTADVAIVGLRLRYNDRGELKMTTTPPSIETGASTTADRYFPHIVDSRGWSTQFILFSGTAGQASSGTLSFIDTAGEPWDLPTESSVSEGFAPLDEQAFNSLVVGNRLNSETFFTDFVSVGRFLESGRLPGSYSYANTGPDTGTFTLTYDRGDYGGACTVLLTFASATTGTLNFTCRSGIEGRENWSVTPIGTPPAPQVAARSGTDTAIEVTFIDSFEGGGARAYDFEARTKTPQGSWGGGCNVFTNTSSNAVRASVTQGITGLQPGTVYQVRYRYRNSSSCDTGTPGNWSLIGEGRTGGSGQVGDTSPSFGTATVSNRTYTVGTAISALTLPAASGGDGTLTYSLSPTVAGLTFSSATRRLTGTPTAAGTYTMTYTARDADGDIATLRFTITVATTQMTTVDLVVASASVSSDTPMPGQSFELRAAVRNAGTGASTATTLRYYRSTDTTISTGDTEVGTDPVGALAAAGTSDESISLTAPSTAGTYYYGACVDPVSGESNSQNNCSTAVFVTVSASQMEIEGFDLASENRSPEGIAFVNDRFYVVDWRGKKVYAYQTSWQRDLASDFDLDSASGLARGITFANGRFYVADFSNDKVYAYQSSGQRDSASDFDMAGTGWPGGITFANDRFYVVDNFDDKVYAYQSSGQRDSASDFDLDSANGDAEGIAFANETFYVVDDRDDWIYAYDASGQRASASDLYLDPDNEDATGITFANGRVYLVDDRDRKVYVLNSTAPSPDLVISTSSVSSSRPVTGQSFDLRATVRNRGTATSTATTLRYYRSSDTTISTSDTEVGTDAVGALSRQATSAETITLTAPATTGTYYYGACVGSVSGEPYTDNNCSSSRRVTVTARVPDLLVESPSVSDNTPGSEGSFEYRATVRNRGTSGSTATTLRYYRSDDRTISTGDLEVGTDAVSALAIDGASSQTITLPAPTAAGTYYYGACVDRVAEESDTGNNCSTAVPVFAGGPFPEYDLDISRIILHSPFFVIIGRDPIPMTVDVTNNGPNASRPAKLRFTGGDSIYLDIPVLEPNETMTYERQRVGTAQFGTTTYRACIVEAPGEENTANNCESRSVTYQ